MKPFKLIPVINVMMGSNWDRLRAMLGFINMPGKQLISILLLIMLGACHSTDKTWQHIQESKVITVGVDPTYPPFELADGIPVEGLDIDLARAIGAKLGVTAEFVYFGYDGLYDALLTKQVDILISALVITPERMRDFAYSDPYFNAGEILVVRQTETDIAEMADLNGRILAVELGAQGHVEALQWERQLPNLIVEPYNSPDDALTAVSTGDAAATLIDSISGRLFIKEHPQAALQWLPDPVTVEPYAIVVRSTDQSLLQKLNDSLAQLQTSGELSAIIEKWLGS